MSVTSTESVSEWIQSWDAQQEFYVVEREGRFAAVVDTVAGLVGSHDRPVRILDLGCGPAALSSRLLERLPTATYLGVDIDPVLLHLAEVVIEPYGDRGALRTADLRKPGWDAGLENGGFDAVVSSTALHWLEPGDLRAVFGVCRRLLRDDGVFVNADNLRYSPEGVRLQMLSDRLELEHQAAAEAAGAHSWFAWWGAARADDVLGPLCRQRDDIFGPPPSVDDQSDRGEEESPPPLAELYVALLRDVGFAVVDTVWQRFDDRVLVALPTV